jgi:TonB family protein
MHAEKPTTLAPMLLGSLAVHVALGLGLWATGLMAHNQPPKSHHVITTQLVRLGPERKKDLLPTLAAAAAKTPKVGQDKLPAVPNALRGPSLTQAAASKAADQAQRAVAGRTRSALDRLRQVAAGAKDGDAQGEADIQAEGDRYASEISQCLKTNYVIEGTDPTLVAGRHALVILRIGGNGKIIGHRIDKGSGLPAFDAAVSRAVRRCGQVSPPPEAWRERLRQDGIEIEFSP